MTRNEKIAIGVILTSIASPAMAFDATAFNFVAAVPEPATWMMMLVGFGAIGWRLRRRKARVEPKSQPRSTEII